MWQGRDKTVWTQNILHIIKKNNKWNDLPLLHE